MREALTDLRHRYLEHLRVVRNASEHSLRAVDADLRDLLRFLADEGRGVPIERVDPLLARAYVADLAGRVGTRTVARKLSTLKSPRLGGTHLSLLRMKGKFLSITGLRKGWEKYFFTSLRIVQSLTRRFKGI